MFANKTRINKKRYCLNPGLTDFMEKFLEEQETSGSYQTSQPKGFISSSLLPLICKTQEKEKFKINY